MRKALLIGAWLLAAICLFFVLVYAGEYSEQECIKSGGSWEQFVWSKGCRK